MVREPVSTDPSPAPSRDGEQGVALILGILFTIIALGITVAGAMLLKSHRRANETNFVLHGQALQIAKSGLAESLGWFRRQTDQPVEDFEPTIDKTANPPILDTEDPDIGIVREFKITGAVWGRYEVWKEWFADPDPERAAWREQHEARDVTTERQKIGKGGVWSVRSFGYVYRREDPDKRFDEYPNYVLAQDMISVEMRRLALRPPAQAALSVSDGNDCHINTMGRVLGGSQGAGIFYPKDTGEPTTGPLAVRVNGDPPLSPAPYVPISVEEVFGVPVGELRAMADSVITDPDDFPSPVPMNSIVFGDFKSIKFTKARPLAGTAVVYIKGNVSISQGSNSTFNGLLYVDGNLTVRDPSETRGAVVCTGNVTVQGSADFAKIVYDDDVLKALRRNIGQYRLSRAYSRPLDNR